MCSFPLGYKRSVTLSVNKRSSKAESAHTHTDGCLLGVRNAAVMPHGRSLNGAVVCREKCRRNAPPCSHMMWSLFKSIVSQTKFKEPFRQSPVRSLEKAADLRQLEDSAFANMMETVVGLRSEETTIVCESQFISWTCDYSCCVNKSHFPNEQSHCCFQSWYLLLRLVLCWLILAFPHLQ